MNRLVFDEELRRGVAGYEDTLGEWWLQQSANGAHRRAYRRIADYIRDSLPDAPRTIVDYACGPGHLLSLLAGRFPESTLVGIDGSERMLAAARARLARGVRAGGIRLQRALLPDFSLPGRMADVVVYTFPNLLFPDVLGPQPARLGVPELSLAQSLALRRDGANDDDPEQVYQGLLRSRIVSLNIRGLLRRGGVLFRVDYAGAPRRDFTRLQLERAGFEEASTELAGDGRKPGFRLAACRFSRSSVTADVHHQSGDAEDLLGGYSISVFRAR